METGVLKVGKVGKRRLRHRSRGSGDRVAATPALSSSQRKYGLADDKFVKRHMMSVLHNGEATKEPEEIFCTERNVILHRHRGTGFRCDTV